MRARTHAHLPADLAAYAPGRIHPVERDDWTVPDTLTPTGVLIELPRYALELRTRETAIDPARVCHLLDRAAVRPIETRPVHVTMHRRALYVVGGHHELAAHLANGAERILVAMHRPAAG
jgi:hypothetical protein